MDHSFMNVIEKRFLHLYYNSILYPCEIKFNDFLSAGQDYLLNSPVNLTPAFDGMRVYGGRAAPRGIVVIGK